MSAFILASRSPRRRELLEKAGFRFDICDPNIPEVLQPHEQPTDYVVRNATEKAKAVAKNLQKKQPTPAAPPLILAADTIVVTADGLVLEKPQDESHALAMLANLSADVHFVHTGFCLFQGNNVLQAECVTSQVTFRAISPEERLAYAKTTEPYDKAGAYGIQDRGAVFVERIEGSYTNVMGLPLSQVVEALKKHARLHWYD